MSIRITTIAACLLLCQSLIAQLPRWYNCVKVDRVPEIDGSLDDDTWATIEWSENFVDIRDTTHTVPKFETRFKMAWDGNFIYIAAWLEEPDLRASLTQHDTVIFYDNDFEMFIDPDGDHHDYGELEVNALNTHWDLLLTEPYANRARAIDAWDIKGLKKAIGLYGTLNDPSDRDSGWVVEWAIPMKVFGELYRHEGSPKPGDYWKVNFSRVQWPVEIADGRYSGIKGHKIGSENNWVWSPQGKIAMHLPEKWGIVVFTDEAKLNWLPDTILHREQLRLDIMSIYDLVEQYRKDRNRYPYDCKSLLYKITLQWLDIDKLEYRRTSVGFEITYPLDSTQMIRLTDNRQFLIVKNPTE